MNIKKNIKLYFVKFCVFFSETKEVKEMETFIPKVETKRDMYKYLYDFVLENEEYKSRGEFSIIEVTEKQLLRCVAEMDTMKFISQADKIRKVAE